MQRGELSFGGLADDAVMAEGLVVVSQQADREGIEVGLDLVGWLVVVDDSGQTKVFDCWVWRDGGRGCWNFGSEVVFLLRN